MQYIPDSIKTLIQNKPYTIDKIGMSKSSIFMFDDCVLKIQPYHEEAKNEIKMMRWLKDKVPVPTIIHHCVENDISYLLMTRMEGKMSCDTSYLENPQSLVDFLIEGLTYLWQIDTSECPVNQCLDNKLKSAKYQIENGLVDLDNVDPQTFSSDGFKNPEDLYQWLVSHQPQEDLVLSHGDYCLPNIFGKDAHLSGFIDIGRMGIADRWQDIALCFRSLRDNMNGSFGGKIYDFDPDILFEKLGIEKDEEKLNYYLLLDELF